MNSNSFRTLREAREHLDRHQGFGIREKYLIRFLAARMVARGACDSRRLGPARARSDRDTLDLIRRCAYSDPSWIKQARWAPRRRLIGPDAQIRRPNFEWRV
jgi:hypothetical protein